MGYVRGCEVEGLLDENGRVVEEFAVEKPRFSSGNRTFRVLLDCNQYYTDMDATSKGGEDVYSSFNVLMRRKPKENNFPEVNFNLTISHKQKQLQPSRN